MPFADPAVGGVSTRQNVYNPGILQRVTTCTSTPDFDENAAQTVMGRALSCISGRTAVYRRSILLAVSDDFMNETFLGIPCMSGDDKCLTALTMKTGYRTVLQRSARVWSTFPGRPKIFFMQRLGWARNTWRRICAPRPGPLGLATPIPGLHHGGQGNQQLQPAGGSHVHGHRRGTSDVELRVGAAPVVVVQPVGEDASAPAPQTHVALRHPTVRPAHLRHGTREDLRPDDRAQAAVAHSPGRRRRRAGRAYRSRSRDVGT
jgi:hypothetical protein